MSLFEDLWLADARRVISDEGNLTAFRQHYESLSADKQRNVYALVSALSKIGGGDDHDSCMKRIEETGLYISLRVSVSALRDEATTYNFSPTVLREALECWDEGKDHRIVADFIIRRDNK